MMQNFRAVAVGANVIVAPHRFEFRSESAKILDERLNFLHGPCARGIRAERRHYIARDMFPIGLRGADARVAEDKA